MQFIPQIILKILKRKSVNDFEKNKNSKIGKNFKIGNFCSVSLYQSAVCIFGNTISIRNYCNFLVGKDAKLILHDRVFMNNYCSINAMHHIEIGENTLLGEGVKLYDHNHKYGYEANNNFKIEPQQFNTSPIKIGKNCWLGSNVIILKGVTIGDNCIIGAGCVIYKDVLPNSLIKSNQEYTTSSL